jgi:hypothetical protein
LKDGFARSIFPDGGYYEGMWKNGKRDGFGKEIFSNGNLYVG